MIGSGCGNDSGDDDVSPTDLAPSASIISPEDGSTVTEGEAVTFQGLVSDDVDAPSALTLVWESSLDGALGSSQAASDGTTSLTTKTLSVGSHQISLTATDSAGQTAEGKLNLTVEEAPNQAPTATITAPLNGSTYPPGTEVTFTGRVSDKEDDPTSLKARFLSSLDGDFGGVLTPDASGVITTTFTLSSGTHAITLSVTDSGGLNAESKAVQVVITSNSPPEVDFTGPDETRFAEGATVSFTAVVSDDVTVANALQLSWSSDIDGALAECPTRADASGDVACDIDSLTAGDHVITLTAKDGSGLSASAEAELTINGAPGAPQVSIEPTSPKTDDPLKAVIAVASIDPNDDTVTYKYAWYNNNVVTGVTTSSVPASSTRKGDTWKVVVTPFDGELTGKTASASILIGNTAPSLTSATVSPSTGYNTDTYTCVPDGYYDADFDAEDYLYQWLADDVEISGATQQSVKPSSLDPGSRLACRVTPTDGTDTGSPVTSGAVVLGNRAPSATSAKISPSSGGEATTFSCDPSGWSDPDGDPEGYKYQWLVNSAKGPTERAISGSSFAKNDVIVCQATPFDGQLTGSAVQSASLTVSNTAPTVSGLVILPNPAYADSILRCQTQDYQDIDGDAEVADFQWTLNGKPVDALSSASLSGVFKRGDVIGCTALVSDGSSTPVSVKATSVTISNAPPSITSVALNPSAGGASTSFTALPQGYSDADGDPAVYVYQWYVNGLAAATSATIPGGSYKTGDQVYVTVTPTDGSASGTPKNSATVVIGSTTNPPSIASVSLSPTTAYETTTLTCAPLGASDPEGDSISFTYSWTKNGTALSGATQAVLTGTSFAKHDVIQCAVTPKDNTGLTGAQVSSNKVTISNSVPTISTVAITPTQPTRASTLTCNVSGQADVDGDTVTIGYSWAVNSATVSGQTGSTLTATYFKAGDKVTCTATPNDGEDAGTALTSAAVTVQSSLPVCQGATLTPTTAYETTTLTCAPVDCIDADGDTVTVAYAWLKGSSAISGQTASTLTGSAFNKGDNISCQVTPSSAGQSGSSVKSNAVTILNTPPVITKVDLTPATAYETTTLICTPSGVTDADGETPSLAYSWTVAGKAISATSSTLTGSNFSRGDQVKCSVTPSDSSGAGTAVGSNTLIIQNSAPSITSVTLSPDPADENSVLSCTPNGASDADSDAVSYLYTWLVNSAVVSGAATPTLTGTSFKRGDSVACRVTPADDSLTGTPVTSNTVVIANQAPTVASASLSPLVAYETSTLTCSAGATADADGDKVTVLYSWKVNGAVVTGATGGTLGGASFAHGDAVQCLVTPNDGVSNGTTVASNQVTISNSVPGLQTVTLGPSSAYESSTLQCTPSGASDPDPTDTISYIYRWTVNGSTVSGATTASLTGSSFKKADKVRCAVTPTDGDAAGTEVVSNELTILNTKPTVSGVALTPTTAAKNSTLTCSYTSTADDDADTVTVAYSWSINGSTVTGATTSTLAGNFKKGDKIVCTITPSDNETAGDAVSSNQVTIGNSAPSVASVSLSPTSPTEKSTLSCSASGAADIDGDTVTLAYVWKVNSTTVSGATTSSLTGTAFNKGDKVTCEVTPNDGTVNGSTVKSNEVTVVNSAPEMKTIVLSPSPAYETSTLGCDVTTTDADPSDTVTVAYSWKVGSTTVTGQTGSTLTGAFFKKGDSVTCIGTPSDGSTAGTAATSNAVVISNSLPALDAATLGPEPAYNTSTLVCTPGTTSDADGDSVTLSYAWTVNGSTVSGQTGTTLTTTYFKKGDKVTCGVTPNDGTANGSTVTSNEVTILNSPPALTSASLTPTSATRESTFSCSPQGFSDGDGDTAVYTYAWLINGSVLSGATSSSLSTGYVRDDQVQCRVTPGDGTTTGSAVTSNAVTVQNAPPKITSVAISPSSPSEGEALSTVVSASDADSDVVQLGYVWTVDGNFTEYTGSSIPEGVTLFGEEWSVIVTPNDGVDAGASDSDTVTIGGPPDADGDGYTTGEGDCDDEDSAVAPYAPELLDGKDNDCNDLIDDRWAVSYTYGSGSDLYGTVGSDTAIQVENDGLPHILFAAKDSGSGGGTLFNRMNTSTKTFDAPSILDTVLSSKLQRLTLWQRTGLSTEARGLWYDTVTTGKAVKFRAFTPPSVTGTTITVASGTSGAPLTVDSLAMATVQSSGTDYVMYPFFDGVTNSGCGTQLQSKIVIKSRTSSGTSFSTYSDPLTTQCGTSATLTSVGMQYASQDNVLHTSWYNGGATSTGLNYRRMLIPTSGSPSKIVAVSGANYGVYNSIAVVPGGTSSTATIAYYDPTLLAIRTITSNDTGTSMGTPQTVVDTTVLGSGLLPTAGRIVFRYHTDGKAHLLFQAAVGTQLWYATNASGSWVAERVLTMSGGLGTQQYAMVLDADGNPRITYYDSSNADLKYIRGKVYTSDGVNY